MFALLCFVLSILASPFKSKSRLEAENVVLRHQLIVLRRKVQGRVWVTDNDRWFFIQLYQWFPSILQVLTMAIMPNKRGIIALTIVRPETLVRWHQAGFRRYWRWKSRPRGGRPLIESDLIEQRCAGLAPGSADRNRWVTRDPWRASSPLCPGLGFRYKQVLERLRHELAALHEAL